MRDLDGLVLGFAQLALCRGLGLSTVVLPVSGLVFGMASNWLALAMCFRPVDAVEVSVRLLQLPDCVLRVLAGVCGAASVPVVPSVSIQGLFLKRRAAVAKQYSAMLTKNFFNIAAIHGYLATTSLWTPLWAAFLATSRNATARRVGWLGRFAPSGAAEEFALLVFQELTEPAVAARITAHIER